MEVSTQDLIDRLSIILMKVERLGHPENKKELENLKKELSKRKFNVPMGKFIEAVCLIATANADTWNLEADIRNRDEKNLGLEEVGRRALKIRDSNSKRIQGKNKIGELTSSGFKEIKWNHRSQK